MPLTGHLGGRRWRCDLPKGGTKGKEVGGESARSGALEECPIRRFGGVPDPALWGSARSGALGECPIRRFGGVPDPALWRR